MPRSVEETLEALARSEITPRQAVRELVALGLGDGHAEETVYAAIGGSDITVVGDDGQERCYGSGKLVSELEREMRR
jgi:hypothetical protein